MSLAANRTRLVFTSSFLFFGGASVARADYVNAGPLIDPGMVPVENADGTPKRCDQLTAAEMVQYGARVPCSSDLQGGPCSNPTAPLLKDAGCPGDNPSVDPVTGIRNGFPRAAQVQGVDGNAYWIRIPQSRNAKNCTISQPPIFFDCYGCYETTPNGAPIGNSCPHAKFTRHEVRRYYTEHCNRGTSATTPTAGTIACNYVTGLQRVSGSYGNYPVDAVCQSLVEQTIASTSCINDSDSACNLNGCGTLQQVDSPLVKNQCSISACTPLTQGCASASCPSAYGNWECVSISGAPTCVIDRDQDCSKAVASGLGLGGETSVTDNAGSTFTCAGQSNPSIPKQDCGAPTEIFQTSSIGTISMPQGTFQLQLKNNPPPWFHRPTLGDVRMKANCRSTPLSVSANQLPKVTSLAQWVMTCDDSHSGS
jgi:hypothetical protein